MSIFEYKAVDQNGDTRAGTIDAVNKDIAISSLQRRGLVIQYVNIQGGGSLFNKHITFFERVKPKEVVMLSRQIATLFEAQVSALRIFRLLSAETESRVLGEHLVKVADDLQGGSTISDALAKHPKIFSKFFVNMVKTGEETGKLDKTFSYLADYIDRTYKTTSKAKNALIYPAFVIFTFIAVMVLMLTTVIPKLATILTESGQEIPVYTKIVLGISYFLTHYSLLIIAALIVGGVLIFRFYSTEAGKVQMSKLRMSIPYVGSLYQKLFLSRLADNLSTMLSSGIQMVRAVEITADVVDDAAYSDVLKRAALEIQGGRSASEVFSKYPEFPGIIVAMIRIGEETGELGAILDTMAKFYRREVQNAVDTLVTMIEPIMIVTLAVGVGVLLASVLVPIYNVSAGI
ncbi:MAG: type II secretion system F family protein [Candidatus Pacebacteria bacterium]|nr:type II secretion system F family protein [Candidatus Paceibacterota bacterium]